MDPLLSEFYIHLNSRLLNSFTNYYTDNYDYLRFGQRSLLQTSKECIKKLLFKSLFIRKSKFIHYSRIYNYIFNSNSDGLLWFYEHLQDRKSRDLLIDLIIYKILGHNFVKLSVNEPLYWRKTKQIEKHASKQDQIKLSYSGWKLKLFDLNPYGYDIKIYNNILGVNSIFILEQYAYMSEGNAICTRPGDIVIDAGGCWGDGALYFASKVGSSGRVFSFEFIPQNIEIFEKNVSLNDSLSSSITLIKQPLWDISGEKVYYEENGPSSVVSFDAMKNSDGEAETITIDRFVEENKIDRLDFIKMDIEGAESFALKGAQNTIKRFKPKLAISIYHKPEDFVEIPRWIYNLNLNYKFFLGHYSIHSEETVLFAIQ